MKYVIIGNSTAGISAAEAIRSKDPKGSITLISEEAYTTYSHPLITYWLAGKLDSEGMYYKGRKYAGDLNASEMLGRKAVELDVKKKKVRLEGGEVVAYDRLLIATGGTPFVPPVKGGELNGVFTFTKWEDARAVKAYISKHKVKKVVVVGGGLIGLKTTEALVELGLKVTVLELADRILSATFDKKASKVMLAYLKDRGVDIITENTVEEIRGVDGSVAGVSLRDGRKIACGLVILAIGVRPNMEIVQGTGMATGRGIIVDSHMETSIPDVYAAGDVAEAHDCLIDSSRTIAIWPLAVKQGRVAGLNMAGVKTDYPGGFPMNSVEIHGLPTISVGITDPVDKGFQVIKDSDPDNYEYRKIVLKDGKVKGVIFIGRIDRAGIFTGLIGDKVDVDKIRDDLLNDDFGLITLPKGYMKHEVKGPGMSV
ncbi:MAG: FAD-dependent oxidoreductase [Candidatus Altiarchaeota archaeon]